MKVVNLSDLRKKRVEKPQGDERRAIGEISMAINLRTGEVTTKGEADALRRRRDEVERAGKDRI